MTHAHPHGIQSHRLEYGCLAGTIGEFAEWKRRHQIPLGSSMFISGTSTVHAALQTNPNISFHIVGTFPDRPDAQEVLRIIQERRPGTAIYTDR